MVMKKNKLKKDIAYYMNLPWTYTIETDIDKKGKKFFVVKVNELHGVSSDGLSMVEALDSIKEAMILAFEMDLEAENEIPEPIDEEKYQGNISYRTTPRIHYFIAQEAQKRGQSLSRVIDSFIQDASKHVGRGR